MRAVNLLPADARVQQQRFTVGSTLAPKQVFQRGGIAAAVIVVLVGGLYVHGRSVLHSKENHLASTKAQLTSVQAELTKVQATQKQARARFDVLQAIATTRMNWDGTLLDLAHVIPGGVYLTNLSAAAATKSMVSATAATSTFTIGGSAPSYVVSASVLDRLALLPWLSDISLQSLSRQADGSVTFSIQATVVPGGER
jgi:Tfp pilus assembly protein PilN